MNIYVCGPTIYNKAHIGNVRPILIFDIYVRALKALNKQVVLTHNITDIDDKIIDKALKLNLPEKTITLKYLKHYNKLLKDLNINCIDQKPLVSDNIKIIIQFIINLIAKKVAYVKKGNVFFNVLSAKYYGNVSKQKLQNLKNQNPNQLKTFPLDFVLWKKTNKGITFDSPWGKGRPGWHTECVALIDDIYHKQSLDIHSGGIDLVFPHHENEDAQFRALNNKSITKKWKHIGQMNLKNIKMSKSLGNIIDTEEFIKIYSGDLLRIINLMSSPSKPLNIDKNIIKNAQTYLDKFKKAYIKIKLLDIKEITNSKLFILISKWKFAEFNKKLNIVLKDFNSNNNVNDGGEILYLFKTLGFHFSNINILQQDKDLYFKWINYQQAKKYKEADQLRNILIKKGLI